MIKRMLAATTCVLALGLLGAQTASAKDICISVNNSWRYVFKKVKTLEPGGAIPLTGMYVYPLSMFSAPADGTAIMKMDGTVKIGVFVQRLAGGAVNYTEQVNGDANFNATGFGDSDGDYDDDFASTWTRVDCSSIQIP